MLRTEKKFSIKQSTRFKALLFEWSQQFNEVIWLDSNHPNPNKSPYNLSDFDAVLAVDAHTKIESTYKDAFHKLKAYQEKINDYSFGYFGYDLKNDIEDLTSKNIDELEFPDLYFFQPKKIIELKNNEVIFRYIKVFEDEIATDYDSILNYKSIPNESPSDIKIKLRIHKDEYFDKIDTILKHISRGDIYEVCFCQEFYAENAQINPFRVYQKLNAISKTPFASFLKLDANYLISASPERFIKRTGNTVISQPIKGTIQRGANSNEENKLKHQLETDEKERSENIMIVDLVRNDLSRTAIKGSVKTVELCKVYSFKQVHQLISTIESQVKSSTNSVDIIKSLFPMGSMTGAPKVSAMKIIEALEETKRGLFSAALGYFKPNQDFDFNVIIRSILYNKANKYVSYSVGGAITSKSTPEKEYEECLLKARALRQVLLDANA